MEKLKVFLYFVDNANQWVGKVTCWLVYIMVLVLVYESVLRYGFDSPTRWAHEITQHLFGFYFVIAGGFALYHGAHVSTDVIVKRLSPRTRAIVDATFWIFFFFFCGILLWKSVGMAEVAILRQETTMTSFRSPVWPVKLAVPVGAFLILLQGIAKFVRDIFTAVTGRWLG